MSEVLLLEQTYLWFHCKAYKILEMYIIMLEKKVCAIMVKDTS
jgi:hypothetical protein